MRQEEEFSSNYCFTPEKFLSKNRSANNQFIMKKIRSFIQINQRKITKSVYNLETRDIKKFSKDLEEFNKRMNEKNELLKNRYSNDPIKIIKKYGVIQKYEENQHLERDFDKKQKAEEIKIQIEYAKINKNLNKKKGGSQLQSKGSMLKDDEKLSIYSNSNSKVSVSVKNSKSSARKFNFYQKNLLQIVDPRKSKLKTQGAEVFQNIETRKKSTTHHQKDYNFLSNKERINRKRVVTLLTSGEKRSTESKGIKYSIQKLKNYSKEQLTLTSANQTYVKANKNIIELTSDKMMKYIKNLHKIVYSNHYITQKQHQNQNNLIEPIQKTDEYRHHMMRFRFDSDLTIKEEDVNELISKRYKLFNSRLTDVYDRQQQNSKKYQEVSKNNKFISQQEYSLLNSLSKESIFRIIKKEQIKLKSLFENGGGKEKLRLSQGSEKTIYKAANHKDNTFSLPFAEFISLEETKKSLHRIINMSVKNSHRLAFNIFDKNKNNTIDQSDLIQLMNLTEQYPILQDDLLKIAHAMIKTPKNRSIQTRELILIQTAQKKHNRSLTTGLEELHKQKINIQSIEEKSHNEEESLKSNRNQTSNRFTCQKLFTFLQENSNKNTSNLKTKGENQSINSQSITPLNFSQFSKIFQNCRPKIFIDLIQNIFGIDQQDFTNQYKDQIAETQNSIMKEPKSPLKYLGIQSKNSIFFVKKKKDETIEQKWNRRLISSNNFIKKQLKYLPIEKLT